MKITINQSYRIVSIFVLIVLTLVGILMYSTTGIQKGDAIVCVAGVEEFSGEVVYKKKGYIVVNGINSFYEYGDSKNCPVEYDKYGNCVWLSQKTGEWIMDIKNDNCYRPGNYDDMIKLKLK